MDNTVQMIRINLRLHVYPIARHWMIKTSIKLSPLIRNINQRTLGLSEKIQCEGRINKYLRDRKDI